MVCLLALLITAGVMSAKGYGISVGKLYFADNGTYLIDEDDKAMRISDQSDDGDLFKGYANGDRILVIHDGVEESYPPCTCGHYAFRFSKGDGTYKPADEVLGIEYLGDNGDILAAPPIDFGVQYIRTDGYHEDVAYPVVRIIRSIDELYSYYNANKEKYDLDRKEKVYADSTIGFLDACNKYDEAYFEKQILVMVLLEEGRGSIRHNVQSFSKGDDGIYYVNIDTIVPEMSTDDMGEWHILVEPETGTVI